MNTLLDRFKRRMKISHSIEDETLQELLNSSIRAVKSACGDFDIEENESAVELVIERTRYVYNDALEFFDDNFSSRVTSLALDILSSSTDVVEVVAND